MFLRKVLFEMVEGRFGYNLEDVHIYDYQNASDIIQTIAGADTYDGVKGYRHTS